MSKSRPASSKQLLLSSSIPEHDGSSSNTTTTTTNIDSTTTSTSTTTTEFDPSSSPTCPFCNVISHFPPVDPFSQPHRYRQSINDPVWNPDKLTPPSYVLLSTEHVVAFLDIAPLTRGHVLVTPRRHRVKVGDLLAEEMSEVGRLLPIIARAVIKAVLPDIPHREADYNIIQNNGPGAAQVVPHVHFHIVPRPPLNYEPPTSSPQRSRATATTTTTTTTTTNPKSQTTKDQSKENKMENVNEKEKKSSSYNPSKIPTGIQRSYVQFGRGVRHELDEDDANVLVDQMRRCIAEEIDRVRRRRNNNEDDDDDDDGNGNGNGNGDGNESESQRNSRGNRTRERKL